MEKSQLPSDYERKMFVLKCVNDSHAKRELTFGKEYHGFYFPEDDVMFIKTDYGKEMGFQLQRFELVKALEMEVNV